MAVMNYAIIKIGGNQYKVSEEQELVIDKIEGENGGKVEFSQVLLAVDGKKVRIGTPNLAKAKVIAEIIGQERGEKLRIAKFRAKSRYRRAQGFRSHLTRIKIKKIIIN